MDSKEGERRRRRPWFAGGLVVLFLVGFCWLTASRDTEPHFVRELSGRMADEEVDRFTGARYRIYMFGVDKTLLIETMRRELTADGWILQPLTPTILRVKPLTRGNRYQTWTFTHGEDQIQLFDDGDVSGPVQVTEVVYPNRFIRAWRNLRKRLGF